MGINNQSTWNQNCVCLPCTEKENYADLDAADQVNAQWEDYKKELKSFGLYRENLIHLIGKEIKDKQKTFGDFNFVCPHNRCGFFRIDDCTDITNCCHHSFQIDISARYALRGWFKCFFWKTPDRDVTKEPLLRMKYQQYADTRNLGDGDLRNGCNGFINNTLRKHCIVEHVGKDFPPALLSAKYAKEKSNKGELCDTTSLSAYLNAGMFVSMFCFVICRMIICYIRRATNFTIFVKYQ